MLHKTMSNADENVRPWFRDVRVGDMLNLDPLWNRTERESNRLDVPTKVLGITDAASQSGVLFEVRTKGGFVRHLDASWFNRPSVELNGTPAALSPEAPLERRVGRLEEK